MVALGTFQICFHPKMYQNFQNPKCTSFKHEIHIEYRQSSLSYMYIDKVELRALLCELVHFFPSLFVCGVSLTSGQLISLLTCNLDTPNIVLHGI